MESMTPHGLLEYESWRDGRADEGFRGKQRKRE